MPHMSIDLGNHLAELRMKAARARRHSAATLFIDFESAFYRVLTEEVLGRTLDEDTRRETLAGLGWPEGSIAAYENALGEGMLARWGAAPWAAQAVADWHACSYYQVDDDPRVACPVTGVRPGDPLADLVFNACMAVLLRDLRGKLRDEGLLWSTPLAEGGPFAADAPATSEVDQDGPTWVDDETVFCCDSCPVRLLMRTRRIVELVDASARRHGLQLNVAPGKTEVLLFLAGQGRDQAQQLLKWDGDQASLVISPLLAVRVARSYKHLGTVQTRTGNRRQELVRRATAATAVHGALRRVFANRGLARGVRLQTLTACMDAALLSAAGCWAPLADHELAVLNAPRAKALRRIAGIIPGPGGPTDREVCAGLRVPSLADALVAQRLRYLGRLLLHGPGALFSMIQAAAGNEWRAAVVADLGLLRATLPAKLAELPPPAADLQPWVALIRSHPGPWKALVRCFLAARAAAAPPPCVQPAHDGPPHEQLGLPEEPAQAYPCSQCDRIFDSAAGLAGHSWIHGHRDWTRRFVADGDCPVCRRRFWTRIRAMVHLRRSPACAAAAQNGSVQPLLQERVDELDAADVAASAVARRAGRYPGEAMRPFSRMPD